MFTNDHIENETFQETRNVDAGLLKLHSIINQNDTRLGMSPDQIKSLQTALNAFMPSFN